MDFEKSGHPLRTEKISGFMKTAPPPIEIPINPIYFKI